MQHAPIHLKGWRNGIAAMLVICLSMFISSCQDNKEKKDGNAQKQEEAPKKREAVTIYWRPIAPSTDLPRAIGMTCGEPRTCKWRNTAGYDYFTLVIQNAGNCKVSYAVTSGQVTRDDIRKQKLPVGRGGQQLITRDAPPRGDSVDITFLCENDLTPPGCSFTVHAFGGFKADPKDGRGADSAAGGDMRGLTPPTHRAKKRDSCKTDAITFLEFANMSSDTMTANFTIVNQCHCTLKVTGENHHARHTTPPDYNNPFADPTDNVNIAAPVVKKLGSQYLVRYNANCDGGTDNKCRFDITHIYLK